MNEPIQDLAHLAHVEMLTQKLDASTRFFTEDYLGMKGRFHHVTCAVNSREQILIAADIC